MLVVHVHVHVHVEPAHLDAFLVETRRDAVAGMMARPRTPTRLTAVFPAEDGW